MKKQRTKEDVLTHRLRTQKWRDNNLEKSRACARGYYHRNLEIARFKSRLWNRLMRIRRAVIASGRVPFDG